MTFVCVFVDGRTELASLLWITRSMNEFVAVSKVLSLRWMFLSRISMKVHLDVIMLEFQMMDCCKSWKNGKEFCLNLCQGILQALLRISLVPDQGCIRVRVGLFHADPILIFLFKSWKTSSYFFVHLSLFAFVKP